MGVTKLIINKQGVAIRTCKKVEYTPSKLYGADGPACMACLDELGKQQVTDEKLYDQKLLDDTVRNGDMMIDRRTGEVLGPEVDSTYWKN